MHLPHLQPFDRTPIIFLTTCTHQRQPALACNEAHEVLRDIWSKSASLNGWYVGHYVLMPDHVHLFACPGMDARPLGGWMQLWKAISAKQINQVLGRKGTFWQTDYFDRFVRSVSDYSDKWNYVAFNPVRKGFATMPEEWPYRGIIHDLRHHTPRD